MKESDKFARGIEHFNAHEFFEAHEVWEEIWLPALEPEKTFLQGLIQIAAAFHHYGRQNLRGAQSLLAAGLLKLACFPDGHRELALADLKADARQWAQMLGSGEDPGARKLPRIEQNNKARPSGRSEG